MAESKAKAKNTKKDNKNLIIGICAAVVVVVVIIVAIVVVNANKGLNDAYFVSDNSKYVLTLDMGEVDESDDSYTPLKIHYVYTYSGDEITGLKYYYEYADTNTAKAASDYINGQQTDEQLTDIHADGKYVVATASEDLYKEYSASDIKSQIEFYESIKNMDLGGDSDDATVEETEETTEAEE